MGVADYNNSYKTVRNQLEWLETSDYSTENRVLLKEFCEELLSDKSADRVSNYMGCFKQLKPLIDYELEKADKKELISLIADINRNNINNKDYKEYTLAEFRKTINKLYNWLGQEEKVDFFSVEADKSKIPKVSKEELPSVEQVKRIADGCLNPRDKALVYLIWETGARIGELHSLKWKHINQYERFSKVKIVNSKTETRNLPIKTSVEYVKRWKSFHPEPSPGNPVFSNLSSPKLSSYNNLNDRVSEAAERNNVDCRNNFHAFRKSRATYLAEKGFNIFQLMKWFGWVDTDTALFYIRLAQSDVDRAFMQVYKQSQLNDFESGQENQNCSQQAQKQAVEISL